MGVGRTEAFRIFLALKQLTEAQKLQSVRFWGIYPVKYSLTSKDMLNTKAFYNFSYILIAKPEKRTRKRNKILNSWILHENLDILVIHGPWWAIKHDCI